MQGTIMNGRELFQNVWRRIGGAPRGHWLSPLLPALMLAAVGCPATEGTTNTSWQVGTPIVTYWCGPAMNEASATQMAEGGWNLVWCGEGDLDLIHRHGLRGQLTHPLLSPATLETPEARQKLEALVNRVKSHPALYAYFVTDEPNATNFPGLGRLVAWLRERDPAHLAYINLFPTYANNEQLGTAGDTVTAYRKHLQLYLEQVKPGLISYDHYQFAINGDQPDYFLNLAMIRQAALESGLPFLNIVQACTWTPGMRVPSPDEMRYLVYTTLAYGAQGISYYVYSCAGHKGMIAAADGTPTPLYHALKTLNREFAAIAAQLQPLKSLGVYHAGMQPPGATPLPENAAFTLEPPVTPMPFSPPEPARGVLIGCFGRANASSAKATHAVVVNLDYKSDAVLGVKGPKALAQFDALKKQWSNAATNQVEIHLPRGGGVLLRVENR